MPGPWETLAATPQIEEENRAMRAIYQRRKALEAELGVGAAVADLESMDFDYFYDEAKAQVADYLSPDMAPERQAEVIEKRMKMLADFRDKSLDIEKRKYHKAIKEGQSLDPDTILGTPEQRKMAGSGRAYKLDEYQALYRLVQDAGSFEDARRIHEQGLEGLKEDELSRYNTLINQDSFGPIQGKQGFLHKLGRVLDYPLAGPRAGLTEVSRQSFEQRKKEGGFSPEANPWWEKLADTVAPLTGPIGYGLYQYYKPDKMGGSTQYEVLSDIAAGNIDFAEVGRRALRGWTGGWRGDEEASNMARQFEHVAHTYRAWAEQQAREEGREEPEYIEELFQNYLNDDFPAKYPNLAQFVFDATADPLNVVGAPAGAAIKTGASKVASKASSLMVSGISRAQRAGKLRNAPKYIEKIAQPGSKLHRQLFGDAATDERKIEKLIQAFQYSPQSKALMKAKPEYIDTYEKVGAAMRAGEDRGLSRLQIIEEMSAPLVAKMKKLATPEEAMQAHALVTGNDRLVIGGVKVTEMPVSADVEEAVHAARELADQVMVWKTEALQHTRFSSGGTGHLEEAFRTNYAPERVKVGALIDEADELGVVRTPHAYKRQLKLYSSMERKGKEAPAPLLAEQWEAELKQIKPQLATSMEIKETVDALDRADAFIRLPKPNLEVFSNQLDKLARNKFSTVVSIMKIGNKAKSGKKKLAAINAAIAKEMDRANILLQQSRQATTTEARIGLQKAAEKSYNNSRGLQAQRTALRTEQATVERSLEKVNEQLAKQEKVWVDVSADYRKHLGLKENIAARAKEMTEKTGIEYVSVDETLERLFSKMYGDVGVTKPDDFAYLVPRPVAERIATLVGGLNVPVNDAMGALSKGVQFYRDMNKIARYGATVGGGWAFAARNAVTALPLNFLGLGFKTLDPGLQTASALGSFAAALGSEGASQVIRKIPVLLKNKKITLGEAMDIARDYGILSMHEARLAAGGDLGKLGKSVTTAQEFIFGGMQPAVETVVGKVAGKKVGRVAGLAARTMSPELAARATENYQHFLGFLGALEDTTPQAIHKAADFAAKFTGNYNRMSVFERTVMRDAFMFYGWQRFILPHLAMQVVENPHKIAAWYKYDRARRNERGEDIPLDNRTLGRFHTAFQSGATRVTPEVQAQLADDQYGFTVMDNFVNMAAGILPSLEAAAGGRLPYGHNMAANLSWAYRAAYEMLTGEDLVTGQPLSLPGQLHQSMAAPLGRMSQGLADTIELYRADGDMLNMVDTKLRVRVGRFMLGMDNLVLRAMGEEGRSLGGMFDPDTGRLGEFMYVTEPELNLSRYQLEGARAAETEARRETFEEKH